MDIDHFYKTYGEVELQKQQRLLDTVDSNSSLKQEIKAKQQPIKQRHTITSSDYFASSKASDLRSHNFEMEDEEIPHDEINLFDDGDDGNEPELVVQKKGGKTAQEHYHH